ncbi:MAG TPA: type II toxin-antitoxin system HicA family toxin [Cyclobacteriaceae bacterium]|jgi:predicted RNA binding protein YcfA (HicA-like mRNA interferase family)|nr:type II toxin-antitoxin system HicA family toxin [Cytophagales bacterium]HMR56401.1 type II toxin-antitoxin system HicA family toxin [Cyclobacteriaceae bacterium]HNR75076.1 type II toxin-antitoxin system HicA family toxin [Cyclobacteriaceae bacterium]HRE68094.1 type II toxin-antitoxin system HicA family toxin [Cyclobacteriaceae bacterium]HRF35087.1 type II toxin-antitoxin system HicA family toxin [Cyclobacteriaceae bacterium]
MKLPRNVAADELIKSLQKIGYLVTRQKGSHIRLTCILPTGEHHLTIPNHNPIKIGTLSAILTDVSRFHKISKEELINKIFG